MNNAAITATIIALQGDIDRLQEKLKHPSGGEMKSYLFKSLARCHNDLSREYDRLSTEIDIREMSRNF